MSNEGVLGAAANRPDVVLYDFRNSVRLQDDFVSGNTTTGTIGLHGWVGAGGTGTFTNTPEANRVGIYTKGTSATINTVSGLYLYNNTDLFSAALLHTFQGEIKLVTNDANTQVKIGCVNSVNVVTPANGIYFEKLGADTNWFAVTMKATTPTRTDTGIATSTSWIKMSYKRVASGVEFYLNNVLVATHAEATLPTVFLNPQYHIYNLEALAKSMQIDYFQLDITGITR